MKYFKFLGVSLIVSSLLMISGINASVLGLISIKIPGLGVIYTSTTTTKLNSNQQRLETVGAIDATFGTQRDVKARINWGGPGNYTPFKDAPINKVIYWSEPETKVVGWPTYSVQLRAKKTTVPTAITYNGVYNSN